MTIKKEENELKALLEQALRLATDIYESKWSEETKVKNAMKRAYVEGDHSKSNSLDEVRSQLPLKEMRLK